MAGVLITDPAMPEIRPTLDVDVDVDVICRVIAWSDDHIAAGAWKTSCSI